MSLFNISFDIIGGIRDAIINFLNTLWNSIQGAFAFLWSAIQNFIEWLLNVVRNFAFALVEGIRGFVLNFVIQPTVGFVQGLANRFIERIPQFVAFNLASVMAFKFPDWVREIGEFRAFARFGIGTVLGWIIGEIIRALLQPKPVSLPKPTTGTVPPPPNIQPPPSPVLTIEESLIANITSSVSTSEFLLSSLTAPITSSVSVSVFTPVSFSSLTFSPSTDPTYTLISEWPAISATSVAPPLTFSPSTDPTYTLISDWPAISVGAPPLAFSLAFSPSTDPTYTLISDWQAISATSGAPSALSLSPSTDPTYTLVVNVNNITV